MDKLKNMSPQWVVHLSLWYSHVTAVNWLSHPWMSIRISTIKLNTDCICLGHLASNAWSLQENNVCLAANQSTHTCTIVGIKYKVIIHVNLALVYLQEKVWLPVSLTHGQKCWTVLKHGKSTQRGMLSLWVLYRYLVYNLSIKNII